MKVQDIQNVANAVNASRNWGEPELIPYTYLFIFFLHGLFISCIARYVLGTKGFLLEQYQVCIAKEFSFTCFES